MACSLLSNPSSVGVRTLACPVFVTDLGLRRSDDLQQFYSIHAQSAGIMPLPSSELTGLVVDVKITELSTTIDSAILAFGAETLAEEIDADPLGLGSLSV